MEKELTQIQHTINFQAEAPVNIKDVFYIVESYRKQSFYGNCEVCRGASQITYNGYTFKCPKCYGSGTETKVLEVDRYVVHRYRVIGFIEEISMFDWNSKNGFNKQVKVKLFRPAPRREYDEHDKTITYSTNYGQGTLILEMGNNVYSNYKEAVAEADRLNAEQEAIVKKYNQDYGTHFVFNPPKYDLKSK